MSSHVRGWITTGPKGYESGHILEKIPAHICTSQEMVHGVTFCTDNGRTVTNAKVYVATKHSNHSDLTSMEKLSEPCILQNLEVRANNDEIYTMLGPVLLAVNPLKHIPDPKGCKAGEIDIDLSIPHPYALAEGLVSRLKLNSTQHKKVSQSIVISGESGSGKSETAKMILRHVVKRLFIPMYGQEDDSGLDRVLLNTTPILEAFGNAGTLRNNNSSRFGKFFKLHLDDEQYIVSGSVSTYLLERSRVTFHELGERNYHIFYQMIAGSTTRKKLFMDNMKFAYLTPRSSSTNETGDFNIFSYDKTNFEEFRTAISSIGVSSDEFERMLELLAGVLYLGNIDFNASKQDETKFKDGDPLERCSKLLGLSNPSDLKALLSERKITAHREVAKVQLNTKQATATRDALAKAIYCGLFDWVCAKVDKLVKGEDPVPEVFVGVLDIFGFESFQRNDLEQLLINFANEKLQASFTTNILMTEASLYQSEGLSSTSKKGRGYSVKSRSVIPSSETVGFISTIFDKLSDEMRSIKPNPYKFNDRVHRELKDSSYFGKVHVRNRKECFAVVHYAGAVTYSVERFLEKNEERMPADADALFKNSNNSVMTSIAATLTPMAFKQQKRSSDSSSVVQIFRKQINDLVHNLDQTDCYYVRCLKPNALMKRDSSPAWFDRKYIRGQLRCLGIEEAAVSLRNGLPVHMNFEEMLDSFQDLIQGEPRNTWMSHGRNDSKLLVRAIFYAFNVPAMDYKVGNTQIFLKTAAIDAVDTSIKKASRWIAEKLVGDDYHQWTIDFCSYLIRLRWKKVIYAVFAASVFQKAVFRMQMRHRAALYLQCHFRQLQHRTRVRLITGAAIVLQKRYRGSRGRALALLRIEEIEMLRKKEIEKLKKEAKKKMQIEMERKEEERREKKKYQEKKQEEERKAKKEKQKTEAKNKKKLNARIQSGTAKDFPAAEKTFERVRKKSMAGNHFNMEKIEKAIAESAIQKQITAHKLDQSYFQNYEEESTATKATDIQKENIGVVACKRPVRSGKNWKRRYLVFNPNERTIQYFHQNKGVSKPGASGTFTVNPPDYNPGPVLLVSHTSPTLKVHDFKHTSGIISLGTKPGKYILEIMGGKLEKDALQEDLTLLLAFDKFEDLEMWHDSIAATFSTRTVDEDDNEEIEEFGMQILCPNKKCKSMNNTLLGSTCVNCGCRLLTSSPEPPRLNPSIPLEPWPSKLDGPPASNQLEVTACKSSVKSKKNWKRRFFVLNPKSRAISYYQNSRDKHLLGTFVINSVDHNPPPLVTVSHDSSGQKVNHFDTKTNAWLGGVKPGKYCVEIRGGKLDGDVMLEDRELVIAFDKLEQLVEWEVALKQLTSKSDSFRPKSVQFSEDLIVCKKCKRKNDLLTGSICVFCGKRLV